MKVFLALPLRHLFGSIIRWLLQYYRTLCRPTVAAEAFREALFCLIRSPKSHKWHTDSCWVVQELMSGISVPLGSLEAGVEAMGCRLRRRV